MGWAADFIHDTSDKYTVLMEITYNEVEVALIIEGEDGLELKLYPNESELTVSVEWLIRLLEEARRRSGRHWV